MRTVRTCAVALALIAALALAACSSATGASDASVSQTTGGAPRFSYYDMSGDEYSSLGGGDLYIVQDNETGVRYLLFKGNEKAAMTPLLRADGTPDTDPEAGL